MKKNVKLTALLFAVSLILSGCGGKPETNPNTAVTPENSVSEVQQGIPLLKMHRRKLWMMFNLKMPILKLKIVSPEDWMENPLRRNLLTKLKQFSMSWI